MVEFNRDFPKNVLVTLDFYDETLSKKIGIVPTNPLGPRTVKANFPGQCAYYRITCTLRSSAKYRYCSYIVEPPLKKTPNKGNLSVMNRITCPKSSLSYSANTFTTSEERKPLNNEQNDFQRFHCTIYRN